MSNPQIDKAREHEINFWKWFIETPRFLEGWCGPEPTPELDESVRDFIKANVSKDGMVLDCGSGVVSILNGLVDNDKLYVTDPLAQDYKQIFDYSKHNVVPPIAVSVEQVKYRNLYDIAHIRNALDHSQNPSVGYASMHKAVKPGGFLIVQGFLNEGTFENWQGFHQFDMNVATGTQDDDFVKQQYTGILYYTNRVGERTGLATYKFNDDGSRGFAKKIKLETGRDWFIWVVKKEVTDELE